MGKHTFSIVMPAFNSGRTIRESIASVEAQTYPHWELLIIDDGSSDTTCQLVEDLAKGDPRIRLLKTGKNEGPARARNRGIAASNGRYICFLDSDDLWLPSKLEKQLAAFQRTNALVCYTSYKKMSADGVVGSGVVRAPTRLTYADLLRSNHIGCLTAAYDTMVCGKVYMPVIDLRQDYALWLRLLKRPGHEDYSFWLRLFRSRPDEGAPLAIGIEEPLAIYRLSPHSVSSNKFRAALYQWIIYREHERLSFARSVFYMVSYAISGTRKYLIR
jgi:teichuronic acid biosynthesis glycosyltransferase TuaG